METKVTNTVATITQMLQETPPAAIAELEFVQKKYIQNYNACHREKVGELMYHRNVIHFKQIMAASDRLRACDPFSLYACFATAAVNGYSLDPADDEVYLVPRGGKAILQRQAGAYVRKLMRSGQILYADQVVLVYQGDEYEVEKGRVLTHKERFQTDIIVAGYIRFQITEHSDLYATFRRSDWETWREKSEMKNGPNWNHNGKQQPHPGFLKTKITMHACKAKHWAIGTTPASIEQFTDIEVDVTDDELPGMPGEKALPIGNSTRPFQPAAPVQQPAAAAAGSNGGANGNSFAETAPQGKTVSFDDPDTSY